MLAKFPENFLDYIYFTLGCSDCIKVLMHRKFRIYFLAKIETSVFPMHKYHIMFVLTGEKGVEISACFEALGANFDGHCVCHNEDQTECIL